MPDTLISIFISYAQSDSAFVQRLKVAVGQQGFVNTADRQGLPVGQRWRRALQGALDNCQVLLVVLSPGAVTSEQVQSEYSYALDEGKVIIPLISQACKVPLALRSLQRIDFQDSYEQGLAALVHALQQVARTASSSQREPEPEAGHPWNVPFGRNPFFTGRAQLLEQLHAQLQLTSSVALNQSLALSGLGGIGKTQTAIEYAYRYRQEYTAVFWVRADSREALVADYVAIARLLGLPGQDAQEQLQIVAAMKRWLEQHEGWLLILDNADELSLLTDFLPARGQGYLLLTTRVQATGKIAKSLPVEKMELSEGMQLLLRRAKLLAPGEPLDNISRSLRTAAQKLVEELDGLPLALDQAGAYVEETGCSLSEYLQLYQRRRLALLKRQSSMARDYPHTVASTWSLSFGQVEQANPAAAELLRLCAYLVPDAIPEEIITEGAAWLGPELSPVSADPLLLNEAIQVLRRYSLVKRDPDVRLLYVHRLVQVVLKDAMNEETQQQWAERTVRAVSQAFPEVSFETWSRCERCLPHVQSCAALIDEYHFTFPEAARVLDQAGYYLLVRGGYERAEPLLQQALTIREQVLGPQHPDTATSLYHLAILYQEQSQYVQAEPHYQRALAIYEQQLGTEHPDTATSLNGLAWLYMEEGRYTQAEPLFQRALAIREQVLSPQHPDTATTLNYLARLYHYQSQYAQAESLCQRALAIREQVLGPAHPDVAESLNELANLYKNQGKYEQAELLYQRALTTYEQALGPGHPYTAIALDNLAQFYDLQGKYAQAEPLYQRALTISEQLGPNHHYTAITLNGLAKSYQAQGKYEQAEPLFQRALTIFEKTLGSEHPFTAFVLGYLATLYQAQGKYEQAEPLYQRSLSICEQALGTEHPDTIKARERYRELLRMMQGQESVTPQREE